MSFLTDLLNNYKQATPNYAAQFQPNSAVRSLLGNTVEAIGNAIPNSKEMGISELIKGGPTRLTSARANTNGGATGSWELNPTDTTNPTNNNSGNGDGGTGGGGTGGGNNDFLAILAEQRRQAQAAFDRAKGIYDEGIGLLNQRRGEFQDKFNQGREQILNRYEGERGNLQSAAQGAQTRLSNVLRSLGLGGSAYIKGEGNQRQENARALGDLITQRDANEQANQDILNENNTWARGQEANLNRYLQGSDESLRAANAQQAIDISGYLNNILNNQFALQAAQQGIGGYTPNPFAVNISDLSNSLQTVLPTLNGSNNSQNQAVSLQEQDPRLSLLDPRLRVGGRLYA